MVASFARERVVVPTVHLAGPRPRLVRELGDKLQRYDFSEKSRVPNSDEVWLPLGSGQAGDGVEFAQDRFLPILS